MFVTIKSPLDGPTLKIKHMQRSTECAVRCFLNAQERGECYPTNLLNAAASAHRALMKKLPSIIL